MGECWSCGAQVGGLRYMFTCPACAETAVLKDIRNGISDGVEGQERAMQMIASGLSNVTDAVTSGLSGISDELSNLAGIVQSGFDELKWELQQQTDVLLSIDQTLKTPSQTQAREWREMAEQLRKRDCFDEAEKWFVKSIEMSPLDYRTYIGLAFNYLRKNDLEKDEGLRKKNFDKAEEVLKRSFPHAPQRKPQSKQGADDDDAVEAFILAGQKIGAIKARRAATGDGMEDAKNYVDRIAARLELEKELGKTVQGIQPDDYKSLSHRLIGRICACRGDYGRAAAELRLAIDLSPNYPEGNYDYALYCVQSGKTSGWEEPFRLAISARPGYLNVAIVERRFAPVRQFLSGILDKAYKNAVQAIQDAETKFVEAQNVVSDTQRTGKYATRVNEIAALIATAKSNLASKDYVMILKVPAGATRAAALSCQLPKDAKDWAIEISREKEKREQEALQEKERREWEAFKIILTAIILTVIFIFVLGFVFAIVGVVVDIVTSQKGDYYTSWGSRIGFTLGIIAGVSWGIWEYRDKLGRKE